MKKIVRKKDVHRLAMVPLSEKTIVSHPVQETGPLALKSEIPGPLPPSQSTEGPMDFAI